MTRLQLEIWHLTGAILLEDVMKRGPRGLAVFPIALVFLGSCGSGTEPEVILNPSVAALAGSYHLTSPILLANGSTILADTLFLSADRNLARRTLARAPGPVGDIRSYDVGTYSVNGSTIVLAFDCYSGVCYGTQFLNAYARGRAGQVTQLILNEDGRSTAFERTR